MDEITREQAQLRANRIEAFAQELATLEQEKVLALSAAQQQAVAAHHGSLLRRYREQLDVDTSRQDHQLSAGMRIASVFGAVALSAALFFLFHQFWGYFSWPLQVAIVCGSALASLGLTAWLQPRDHSGYYFKLAAVLAWACFVLNVLLLGHIFNITPSLNALLPWAAMALLLAYQCRVRVLLLAGLLCFGAYVAAQLGEFGGWPWWELDERLEAFMPLALLVPLAQLPLQRRYSGFAAIYRAVGLSFLLVPVLVLAFFGEASALPWSYWVIERVYQCLALLLCGLSIVIGLRRGWTETTRLGVAFGLLLLAGKLFEWFWEVLPAYLFFLLVGVLAVAVLVLLQRWRRRAIGGAV